MLKSAFNVQAYIPKKLTGNIDELTKAMKNQSKWISINSLTAIWPYMAHRFSWALFKLNNFLIFCLFATFDSSKCSQSLQLE
jgi:hypothetical protein